MPQSDATVHICGVMFDVRQYDGDIQQASELISSIQAFYGLEVSIQAMDSYLITVQDKTLRLTKSNMSLARVMNWLGSVILNELAEPTSELTIDADMPSDMPSSLVDFGVPDYLMP